MRTWGIVTAIAAAALAATAADAVDVELRGSVRTRYSLFSPVAGDDYNLELRARPELFVYLKNRFSANLTVRAQRNWGAGEETLGRGDLEIDRAYFDLRLGKWDLRLGRQAINFGQALIWSPVDLVDSNSPLDFDVVKQGVDAVRASYSLSGTASVLALVAFPDGGAISLVRSEMLVGNADLGLVVAEDGRDDDVILGFDVKGDLGVGYWAEGAYHDPRGGDDFYRLVLGLDYSFPVKQQLYFALQYYYDGSGGTGVTDYDYAALAASRRRFLARRYASLISNLAWDDLTSLNGSVIYNLEDRSYVMTAGLARYFFENLEVTVRGSLFRGSGPGEYHPVAGSPLAGRQPSEVYELYLEWRF